MQAGEVAWKLKKYVLLFQRIQFNSQHLRRLTTFCNSILGEISLLASSGSSRQNCGVQTSTQQDKSRTGLRMVGRATWHREYKRIFPGLEYMQHSMSPHGVFKDCVSLQKDIELNGRDCAVAKNTRWDLAKDLRSLASTHIRWFAATKNSAIGD